MAKYEKNYTQKYVSANGDETTLYPKTKAEQVIGLPEEFQKITKPLTAVQVSLVAAHWEGSTAPYTQIVAVDGMTSSWKAGNHTLVSSGVLATDLLAIDADACLTWIDTGNGIITFTCGEEKPDVDFTILIEGVLQKEVNANG